MVIYEDQSGEFACGYGYKRSKHFPQDDKHLLILTNFSLDYALMYLLREN